MTTAPLDLERAAAGAVALLGLPTDAASSYLRGAARGPAAIRDALLSPSTHLTAESGIDLDTDPRFVDVGDVELPESEILRDEVLGNEDLGDEDLGDEDLGDEDFEDRDLEEEDLEDEDSEDQDSEDEDLENEDLEDGDLEDGDLDRGEPGEDPGEITRRRIEEAAAELLDRGARILALGGDHAVTYPLLRALARHHEGLTVVHVDAHPDLYHHFEGDRWSHACVFARVLEADLVQRLIQIGIRAMNPVQRRQAERFGVEVLDFPRLEQHQRRRPGWVPTIQGPIYLSIDLDALDPSCAPGVSHPEPGGLSTRELIHLIQNLDGPVVGADVVELNPARDVYDLTARTAAKLVKEIAARMLG